MFTTWVVVTFLMGLGLQFWLGQKVITLGLVAFTRARAIMDAERRARVQAAGRLDWQAARAYDDEPERGAL